MRTSRAAREQAVQASRAATRSVALGPAVAVGARAEPVGDAAAAEGDPAVRGVLRVDVGVGAGRRAVSPPPSRSGPSVSAAAARSRSSAEFIGSHGAAGREAGGEALGSAHDARAHGAAGAARAPARSRRPVRSWIVTPRRSTARARPCTSRAGCTRAQCGLYVAADGAGDAIRSAVVGGRSASRRRLAGSAHRGELGRRSRRAATPP